MVKPVLLGALILAAVRRNERRSFLMPIFVPSARIGRIET
jgi:hypothetical protein